jgi:hypothetical protein
MIKGAHQHASNDTINNATKGMQDYLKTGINCFIQRTRHHRLNLKIDLIQSMAFDYTNRMNLGTALHFMCLN